MQFFSDLLEGGDVLVTMDLAILIYKVLARYSLLEIKDVNTCATTICDEILKLVRPFLIACDREKVRMFLVLDNNRSFSDARLPSIVTRRTSGYFSALEKANGAKSKGVSENFAEKFHPLLFISRSFIFSFISTSRSPHNWSTLSSPCCRQAYQATLVQSYGGRMRVCVFVCVCFLIFIQFSNCIIFQT
jgi:hypothetical protein